MKMLDGFIQILFITQSIIAAAGLVNELRVITMRLFMENTAFMSSMLYRYIR